MKQLLLTAIAVLLTLSSWAGKPPSDARKCVSVTITKGHSIYMDFKGSGQLWITKGRKSASEKETLKADFDGKEEYTRTYDKEEELVVYLAKDAKLTGIKIYDNHNNDNDIKDIDFELDHIKGFTDELREVDLYDMGYLSACLYNNVMSQLPENTHERVFYPVYSESTAGNGPKKSSTQIANAKGWSVRARKTNSVFSGSGEGCQPPANADVIALTVLKNKTLKFKVKAAADNTPIWIGTKAGYVLYHADTEIKSINVSTSGTTLKVYGALAYFVCDHNQANITALDVQNHKTLERLNCYKNQLTALNLSGATALKGFSCSENQLTSLDLSGAKALKELYCHHNQLTALDLSGAKDLKGLDCSDNKLTALDLSGAKDLKDLYCHNNQLTALDLSGAKALKDLYCHKNQLTALDLSGAKALIELYCGGNKLTALDLSGAKALKKLNCRGNKLTALDLSGAKALKDLSCYNNQLTALDLSGAKALKGLDCSDNKLTALDLSGAKALKELYCQNNQLTALDLSGAKALEYLNCHHNQLDACALNALYSNLPQRTVDDKGRLYVKRRSYTNPGVATSNTTLATAKNWLVLNYYNDEAVTGDGSGCQLPENVDVIILTVLKDKTLKFKVKAAADKTPIWIGNDQGYVGYTIGTAFQSINVSTFGTTLKVYGALSNFDCFSNRENITAINAHNHGVLEHLMCASNALTALNVSDCSSLTQLSCQNNQLTALNLSGATALKELSCSGNKLTTLNLSGATALKELSCYNNQLTALDVSRNSSLEKLLCGTNKLTALDVGNCPNLRYIICSGNQLDACALNALYNSLPSGGGSLFVESDDDSNPGVATSNTDIATNKNWTIYHISQDGDSEITGDGSGCKAQFAVSPATHDYGKVKLNVAASKTFSISNSGTTALSITKIASNNEVFSVSASSLEVPAGGSKTFKVTFKPTAAGVQNATITFTSNAGNHTITVTGEGYDQMGVEDETIAPCRLYPNPANETIYIESQQRITHFRIYDIGGHIVLSGALKKNKINIENLPSGVYMVRLTGDYDKAFSVRFIKL